MSRLPQRVSFTAGGSIGRGAIPSAEPESALRRHLEEARLVIRAAEASPPGEIDDGGPMSAEFERIRWFPLPGEVLEELRADARPRRREAVEAAEASPTTVSSGGGR